MGGDEVDNERRGRMTITEKELLCKNGCGFYGTPQCNGLCSQCWRAHQLEQKRANDFSKNRHILSQEDRKLSLDPKSSLVAIIKKSPSMLTAPFTNSNDATPAEAQSRPANPEEIEADKGLHEYLFKHFSPSVARDLEKHCYGFIDKLFRSEALPEDLSLIVQNFYRFIADKAAKNPTSQEFASSTLSEHVENFVCVRAYDVLFCTRSEEEVVDLSIQERIRSLHWVTQGYMNCALDFDSEAVFELLDDAITEIVYLNSHRAAALKLDCLVKCVEKIFAALRMSSSRPASADEFLPVLIHVILKSNPPLIQSNINFITRFAIPSRTLRGESGYYFTNLCVALSHIQDMKAHSVGVTEEEFEAYTSGHTPAPNRILSQISATKSLDNALKKLGVVADAHKELTERVDQFEAENTEKLCRLKAEMTALETEPQLELPPMSEMEKRRERRLAENGSTN